jgi:hypothetical protein
LHGELGVDVDDVVLDEPGEQLSGREDLTERL